MADTILIIDFGSQFTQLIARRVREEGVYSEIAPPGRASEVFAKLCPKGIILSGGPASVHEKNAPRVPDDILFSGTPILGICYGAQVLCSQLGGEVETHHEREFGHALIDVTDDCPLFENIWSRGEQYSVWMSHGDRSTVLPAGFRAVATSAAAPFAVAYDESRRIYAVQFHPEVTHTLHGRQLLGNFVRNISGCSGTWSMGCFREDAIAQLCTQIGKERVICGLSGGVDSSVAAILLHEAIGDQLTCIFVDNGLLRQGEAEGVTSLFREHYNIPLIHVQAHSTFLDALAHEVDPEQKRKIIGKAFIDIFEAEAVKLGNVTFLAQGTLYPDVIESISHKGGSSVTIKSHHNVGGLPERMNIKLVEPLRELFKDEVRSLGSSLGLPDAFLSRHPFPGPGLAIRCPGAVTQDKINILRKADAIYLDEIRKSSIYHEIWQAFAVLLPVCTVGVMGDCRTYDHVCALRAVTSIDGMTANFYHHEMDFLGKTATRIINEVAGINRVVYDITSKPPGTIEWE